RGAKWLNPSKMEIAEITNPDNLVGGLKEAMAGADIFIGVSAPGVVTEEMIASMNKDSIVFAMANPVPEIMPDLAKKAGAKIVGTGRSDFPNQVNNVLAFPGIFKGALRARCQISEKMKLAAAEAIASMVSDEELNEDYIIPAAFAPGVADKVAKAVIEASK
ncbi:MAG: malic enzyme-like NAD(P)-binding protein, partial [Clostridiaceae bacterium]